MDPHLLFPSMGRGLELRPTTGSSATSTLPLTTSLTSHLRELVIILISKFCFFEVMHDCNCIVARYWSRIAYKMKSSKRPMFVYTQLRADGRKRSMPTSRAHPAGPRPARLAEWDLLITLVALTAMPTRAKANQGTSCTTRTPKRRILAMKISTLPVIVCRVILSIVCRQENLVFLQWVVEGFTPNDWVVNTEHVTCWPMPCWKKLLFPFRRWTKFSVPSGCQIDRSSLVPSVTK